ncbi:hypothetical protein NC651_008727 [Populus alba x Populus x berolinensis]|uniref:Uncharacterized protein n=1 Tax=Populus alba x Populus x berolinensis TaxID=444605 RepID=A0AAD6W960_9ROSI|nr:hypothetical protein NC651_008727 [Populus alba x Populus x berolinensis]KAJ7003878.1 hypothetical protein NC653_008925 [Populus alba x Populus x berolinensis]
MQPPPRIHEADLCLERKTAQRRGPQSEKVHTVGLGFGSNSHRCYMLTCQHTLRWGLTEVTNFRTQS